MTNKELNVCVADNYVKTNKDYLEEQIRICNELLAKEYLSKVNCCDECFCECWCIMNGTKKSRVPYKGCEQNVIRHLAEISTI